MNRMVYLKDVVTLAFDPAKCTGCGMCLAVCARAVFARVNGKPDIVWRDACIECGACQRNCPQGALSVKTGVGCAAAVINQMLGRKSACCVIDDDADPRGTSCC